MAYTEKVKQVLAKQIKDWSDVKGNLIHVEEYEDLILVFDDGRFAHYERSAWPDGSGSVSFSGSEPDIYNLSEAGLITPEEREAEKDLISQERKRWKEKHEREQYEVLKAKYDKAT